MEHYILSHGIYKNGQIKLTEEIHGSIEENSVVTVLIPEKEFVKGTPIKTFLDKAGQISVGGYSVAETEDLYGGD